MCFFYCYGDHRDLHSFPTRRSSDLTGQVLRDFGQESTLGYIVTVGMCREMGPVFTCLTLAGDRKSTRLNSSHSQISYAVFCLKKKNYYQKVRNISNFAIIVGVIAGL